MTAVDVYLASASPRRHALLRQIGVRHAVLSVDVDEVRHAGESALDLVQRLAMHKALAGWRQLGPHPKPVLGADTVVVIDEQILGKPVDQSDAIAMLQRLSGRTHHVMTAVALANAQCSVRVNISTVRFRPITEAECHRYWQSGEPCDKAGAYAVQGFAAVFIERIEGSYSAVMGLPLHETAELLQTAGIPLWCPST